jgi:hypothetical protein
LEFFHALQSFQILVFALWEFTRPGMTFWQRESKLNLRQRLLDLSDYVNWDKLGIFLSALCALHCVLTPIFVLSLPIMARYYLANPYFHVLIAFLILPVGLWAFVRGYGHHHNSRVLWLGLPGLLIVAVVPILVHNFRLPWNELAWMVSGSFLLIRAHWINKRSCAHCAHHATKMSASSQ